MRPLRRLLPALLLPFIFPASGCMIVSGVVAVGDAVVGGVLHAGAAVVDVVTPDFSSEDEEADKSEEKPKPAED